MLDDLIHHSACHVEGNGEANPLIAATAAREACRIDRHEFAAHIYYCTARDSGLYGGVSLDEVLVVFDSEAASAGTTDDPHGYGTADTERIANSKSEIAHVYVRRIAHGNDRQVLLINLDYGDVGLLVGSNHTGLELALVA